MVFELTLIAYPLLFIGFCLWVRIRPQTNEDRYFKIMYPRNRREVEERLEYLKKLFPATYIIHSLKLRGYSGRFARISEPMSHQLERYFQHVYFHNFKKRFIALTNAPLPLKLYVFILLIGTNLLVSGYAWEYVGIGEGNSFIYFNLVYSILLFLFTLLFLLLEMYLLGLLFSFISLFDASGKFRRIGVHFDEIVRSLKPGGRRTKIEIPDSDD